ncbi:IS5 family transposase [Thalassoglobus sp. JC818]|uniref:IS5 family transposase n=1 Tax=Thalassoglobus sp. JC818 TaxID=3232136 RepID=UPI0034575DFF
MARRHELTDDQWESIQDLLSGKAGDPGRTASDNRMFVNAVLFVLKTGIPWEDLPERYGKSNTVWKRFDRWCQKGVWANIFHALNEEYLNEELKEIHIDSSIVKAHPTASTSRRELGEKKRTLTSDGA